MYILTEDIKKEAVVRTRKRQDAYRTRCAHYLVPLDNESLRGTVGCPFDIGLLNCRAENPCKTIFPELPKGKCPCHIIDPIESVGARFWAAVLL